MVPYDPFISNGQCYYGDDELAADFYIPCGNSDIGAFSCCQRGDVCLQHGACFNAQSQNTYIAGCTNPNYDDRSICPDKTIPFRGQQWVGLVRCWLHNETNTVKEEWGPCNEARQPEVNAGNRRCKCDPENPYGAAITGGTYLPATATLPPQKEMHLDYVPGMTPQVVLQYMSRFGSYTTPKSTDTSTTLDMTRVTTTRPSSSQQNTNTVSFLTILGTPVTLSSASTSRECSDNAASSCTSRPVATSTLTTEAKIGISLGSIIGGVSVMLIFPYLFIRYRRRRARDHQRDEPIFDASTSLPADPTEPMLPSMAELPDPTNVQRQYADPTSVQGIVTSPSLGMSAFVVGGNSAREGARGSAISANTTTDSMVASPSMLSSVSSLSPLQRNFNNPNSQSAHVTYHELPIVPEHEQAHELNHEPSHDEQAVTSHGLRQVAPTENGGMNGGWQYQAYHPGVDSLNVLNDGYATGYETGGNRIKKNK